MSNDALYPMEPVPSAHARLDLAAFQAGSRMRIGCAGWAIPAAYAAEFPSEGTHLQRYAARFTAVEINSSFHQPHRMETYQRWAEGVPDDFRFSVKMSKQITHVLRLKNCDFILDRFFAEIAGLGDKLGAVLIQLPPSLAFEAEFAARFFQAVRERCQADVVLEARHSSWTWAEPHALLQQHGIAYVFADPDPLGQREPDASGDSVYLRLHGAPVIYRSSYADVYLEALAQRLLQFRRSGKHVWCIFDNTASGAAVWNALDLVALDEGCATLAPSP